MPMPEEEKKKVLKKMLNLDQQPKFVDPEFIPRVPAQLVDQDPHGDMVMKEPKVESKNIGLRMNPTDKDGDTNFEKNTKQTQKQLEMTNFEKISEAMKNSLDPSIFERASDAIKRELSPEEKKKMEKRPLTEKSGTFLGGNPLKTKVRQGDAIEIVDVPDDQIKGVENEVLESVPVKTANATTLPGKEDDGSSFWDIFKSNPENFAERWDDPRKQKLISALIPLATTAAGYFIGGDRGGVVGQKAGQEALDKYNAQELAERKMAADEKAKETDAMYKLQRLGLDADKIRFLREKLGVTKASKILDLVESQIKREFDLDELDWELTSKEQQAQKEREFKGSEGKLDRASAERIARIRAEAAKARAAKKAEEDEPMPVDAVPGLIYDQKTTVDSPSFRKVQEGMGAYNKLMNEVKYLKDITRKHGRAGFTSPTARQDVNEAITQIQLTLKSPAFEALGVLAGPDMDILKKLILHPYSGTGMWEGPDGLLDRFERFRKGAEEDFENKMKPYGFSLKDKKQSSQGGAPIQKKQSEIEWEE